MSNRGRQNVASYLALDLGLDWRAGGDWFESCLVDYDVCSNWGAHLIFKCDAQQTRQRQPGSCAVQLPSAHACSRTSQNLTSLLHVMNLH